MIELRKSYSSGLGLYLSISFEYKGIGVELKVPD